MASNTPRRYEQGPSLDLLESLLEYAGSYFRLRNFAEATRRGYLSDQLLFVRYLKAKHGVSRVIQVERAHVVEYLSQAERRGLGGATRARKLVALRSLFGYMEEVSRIPASPVHGIPKPKQELNQPRVLTTASTHGSEWSLRPTRAAGRSSSSSCKRVCASRKSQS